MANIGNRGNFMSAGPKQRMPGKYTKGKHVGKYTSNKERKYACPKCPSNFAWNYSLRRHLKDECGREPRYCCPYCSHRAKWKSNIVRHVRIIHKDHEVYVLCGRSVPSGTEVGIPVSLCLPSGELPVSFR
jgi:DNA-directed RNA polymerase subunit RPC12/RpoP